MNIFFYFYLVVVLHEWDPLLEYVWRVAPVSRG